MSGIRFLLSSPFLLTSHHSLPLLLSSLQTLSEDEIAPFVLREQQHYNKEAEREGKERTGAAIAVGLGGIEEGRARRQKIFDYVHGRN